MRRRISLARYSGATEAECDEALASWESLQAEQVQRIQSQPAPATTCRCSHASSVHLFHGAGPCYSRVCGCRYFRNAETRRTDAPSVNEYLRSKGELA